MEDTHYGELTARQTGLIRALIQDKITQIEDKDSSDPKIVQELEEILDIFGGPDNTKAH